MKKLLIIGGGGAGMFSGIVATQLKPGKFEATLFSDEKDIYCRCSTPYIITNKATLKDAIQPDSMIGDYGVNLVHEKIISIDTKHKKIKSDKNKEYKYDKLVITTGASAAKLNIKGFNSSRVFTVRNSEDVMKISKEVKKNKKAVIIGGGVIGIEMAAALKSKGVDVELIEIRSKLLSGIIDIEYAEKLEKNLNKNGVKFCLGSSVKEIKSDKNKKILIIKTKSGTKKISADFIIAAVGISPNTKFLDNSRIKKDSRGYIIVNNKMRTNVSNIYACGDCVISNEVVTRKKTPSPLASVAIQQSKIIGFQLAGYPIAYKGHTNAFGFESANKEYAQVGISEEEARKLHKTITIGRAQTTNVYKDMNNVEDLDLKLIFAGIGRKLVGAEAYGKGTTTPISIASFAISHKMNILKLLRYNYMSHPSMTAWPFMDPIIMATEDAIGSIMKKNNSCQDNSCAN